MVKLIVAKASNNVIGKDNDLVWHLPADMRFFTQQTKGHIVIMGRKNWDSIPLKYRPLSDRVNVVVTRNQSFSDDGCVVFHSLESALKLAKSSDQEKDIYIIGGAQIYKYALENDLVDEMFITFIDHHFEGDAFFPSFDESQWIKTKLLRHEIDDRNPHSFTVYRFLKKESGKE